MSEKGLFHLLVQKIRGKEWDIIPVLRTIPIFEGLAFSDLKKIELIAHPRTFMPEETIFYERQPGAGMYIIRKGVIKLTKTINEERVKIGELRDGEFFGEMSLLDEYPRSAEATAVEKTEALGIFRPDLFSLIESNPKLGYKILLRLSKRLASRLRETTERKLREMG
jgi:CRP/FNR family transcriptional regulator, cyclic AMP receptor protein